MIKRINPKNSHHKEKGRKQKQPENFYIKKGIPAIKTCEYLKRITAGNK